MQVAGFQRVLALQAKVFDKMQVSIIPASACFDFWSCSLRIADAERE